MVNKRVATGKCTIEVDAECETFKCTVHAGKKTYSFPADKTKIPAEYAAQIILIDAAITTALSVFGLSRANVSSVCNVFGYRELPVACFVLRMYGNDAATVMVNQVLQYKQELVKLLEGGQ